MVVAFLVAIGSPPPRPKVELCDGVFTGFAGSLVIPANGMFSALANSASILAFSDLRCGFSFLFISYVFAVAYLCDHTTMQPHSCTYVCFSNCPTAQLCGYVVKWLHIIAVMQSCSCMVVRLCYFPHFLIYSSARLVKSSLARPLPF